MRRRRVLFVTGTRAEFGLMEHALRRIQSEPRLTLQIVATGMHLSRAHGYSVDAIRRAGFAVDAIVPWRGDLASATGLAMAGLAKAYHKLDPDVILVVGDRVEAFAAASAAHLDGRIVAHVHGGDRALGQIDDALRHSISKLAHVHFAATKASGRRLLKLGEDAFRVHVVGTPGIDGLPPRSTHPREPFALVLLHADSTDDKQQARQARLVLAALQKAGVAAGVIIYSNNDPGWDGITSVWNAAGPGWRIERNLGRADFIDHLGRAAFLIGNSSSGIIEAASLGTRVINIGDRQLGRERSTNVVDVPWNAAAIEAAARAAWNGGRPRTFIGRNVYGGGDAGGRMATLLATLPLDDALRRKLIAY